MARRNNKSNTFRPLSDALKLLVELDDYPQHLVVETLVRALADAPRSDWKAKFKGHPVPDLWKRLSGSGEGKPQFAVNPHYEENWIEAYDARGPYTAYGIQIADKVVLPLLSAKVRTQLSSNRQPKPRTKRSPGRPPEYEYDKIERIAEDYIQNYGLPDTVTLLMEKVEDDCSREQPRIQVPGDTQFKTFIGAIHQQHKRRRSQGRKVGN
jgi:hypothetical protein